MKTRTIYFIPAMYLLLFNLLADMLHFNTHHFKSEDSAYGISSLITGQLFITAAFLLLQAAYKVDKEIKTHKEDGLKNDIELIGKV